jgi:hypothetical protein
MGPAKFGHTTFHACRNPALKGPRNFARMAALLAVPHDAAQQGTEIHSSPLKGNGYGSAEGTRRANCSTYRGLTFKGYFPREAQQSGSRIEQPAC